MELLGLPTPPTINSVGLPELVAMRIDQRDTMLVPANYAQKVEEMRRTLRIIYADQDSFVRENIVMFGPKFILGCKERGINTPGERFAQCLLESSKMTQKGRTWSSLTEKFNNFGGVKAKNGHKSTPPLPTQEVIKGVRKTYKLRFTACETKWHGVDIYLDVLMLKRYQKALNNSEYDHFYSLAKAGYCTEPAQSYARSCNGIYKKYKLHYLNKILTDIQNEEAAARIRTASATARQRN